MRSHARRLALPLAFLAFLVPTCPALSARPAGPGLPDTPAGRRVAAFFEAYRDGGEERLAAFFSGAVGPDALKERPAAERGRRLAAMKRELGEVTVRRADARTPDQVVVVTEGPEKRLDKWTFSFGPPPETHLLGIGIDDADASDLAGPPPPMTEAEALAAIAKAVAEAAAADRFSGVVLLARGERTLLHRAVGLASREHGVANRPDTKFNLGSINKLFTKIAIGQLVERGRLSLDDTIGRHLPDYPNPDAAAKVTIRQLLDMQSGIGDFFGPEFDATPKDRLRKNADYLPLFARKPLLFEPGTDRRYSNGGYVVLGEIVAKASGRDYHDYVRENVYARAGMTGTDSYDADALVPNLAEGYTRRGDGGKPGGERRRNVYSRPARGSAAGGGYSTAPDLLRFAAALLGDRLLSPAFTEWILTRTEPAAGRPLGDRRRGGLGAAGGAPGINAALEIDRETGLVLVVLANDDPPAAEELAKQVRRLLDAIRR